MEEAEYCHRLSLMNRGRLIALDTPRRLRETMAYPVLEVRTESGAAAAEALGQWGGTVEAGMFGRQVHAIVRDRVAAGREVPRVLAEAGIAFASLEEVPPSLEDVFIARVRDAGGREEA
jgi:ABC-2 type transport system ATP-binding protein